MSLTGNLEIFPMAEVLRLLARSKKTGCLRVDNGVLDGRVYLDGGAISFANTEDDEKVRRALVSAGLVTDDAIRAIIGTDTPVAERLADGIDPAALTDFMRELVVESLYRIRKPGHGDFEFAVDVSPLFRTGQHFDAEVAVAEADRRASEWEDVLSVVDDLDAPIRMVRSLPDENSVTIASGTWKVLASLEGGTSIRQLSDRTGLSEFRAARELSGLIRSDLVEVVPGQVPMDDGYRAPIIERAPVVEVDQPQPAPDVDEESDDAGLSWDDSSWEIPVAPADEPEANDEGESAGWFERATGESDVWSDDEADATEADGTEEPEPVSDGGWWATATAGPDEAAEDSDESEAGQTDDTDSFLESVFSQLNDVPEHGEEGGEADDADETGFSMGLLRRRRMGTAARDLTND